MLGNHQLLAHKLRKGGQSSLATVVSYKRITGMNQSIQGGIPESKSLCKMTVRVEPEGQPAFEATTEAWLLGTEGTHDGMTVPVLYDPSDHSKLVIDQSDAAWKLAVRENMRAQRVARQTARGLDPSQITAMEEMRRAAASDPEAFRRQMAERGPAAFGLAGPPTGPPVVLPTTPDPLDRLSKLADLHDRGALTDAEFEAQKKKLLEG